MKRLLSLVLVFVFLALPLLTVFGAENKDILPSGMAYSNIETAVDAYVKEHERTTAAVSVAVFTNNDVLMEKAYGYSDMENAIANDKDTVFEWGSNTKLLVWTSVMQLAEKGEINLEEDIRTYLPDVFFTKLKYDTPITMLNLMNHTGGWQETVTDLFIEDKSEVKELGGALKLIEPEQINEPGKIVAYSNWSSALAGYIVECVSGQSFDDYVHEYIFNPLGMKHTAINAVLSDNEWVAEKRRKEKCYTIEKESLGTCQYYLSLYPAGMATGTIGDFIKFGQAFLVDEGEKSPLFQKRETLDEMLSPSLFFADGTTARNCHGFWTDELGVSVLWHNGGTIGSSSWFAFDPKSATGIIVLTNQSNESVYNCGLLPLVFGRYEGNEAAVQAEDISGMYVSSRSVFKGFAKPYSLITTMQFNSREDGGYSIPGMNNTAIPIGRKSYLLDMGELKQFVIYADTDEDGRKILQLPAIDYVEINGYGVIAKYILLGLLILAALYGFIALIISLIRFLKHKNSFGIIGKFRAIVNASVVAVAMLFMYIAVKLFSKAPLLNEVLWCILLNGLLALFPVVYTIILAAAWKRIDCSRKEKRMLIITAIAGMIMTINVIFWESYKFW